MRQFIFLPGLVFTTLLLTGALDRQVLFSDTTSAPPFVPRGPETDAGPLLDRVIAAFAPHRVAWLDVDIWQRRGGDEPYEAEGKYLLGPEQRMRLEMKINLLGKIGHVLAASDGTHVVEANWADGQRPVPVVNALPKREATVRDPEALNRARQEVLHARGLGGLTPLLREVRAGIVNPRQQPGLWQDRQVVKLSGSWKETEEKLDRLPADLRARRCSLILDARSLWPCRLEWIGGPRPQDRPTILLQIELRNPVINRPLSTQECARRFRFDPS